MAPETTEVDLQRLYRMEIARRGTCQDCRRYGRDHTIIRGVRSLACSCCGQEYDCSNWEEVNDDPSHRLLREPLSSPPPTFRSVPRSPPRGLRPPPPLQDRAYAACPPASPLGVGTPSRAAPVPVRVADQKRRTATPAEDGDSEYCTSPVSPIAVTKALPLPRDSVTPKRQPSRHDFEGRQPSEREIDKASKDVNRVGYLRYRLEKKGLANEVDPLPAVHAAKELSKATKGTTLVRTGEVKAFRVGSESRVG